MTTDNRIHVTAYGGGTKGEAEGHIRIEGLRPEEIECLQGMVNGHLWCAVDDTTGRLMPHNRRHPLPAPVDDPMIDPHWMQPLHKEQPASQMQLFKYQPLHDWEHPAIIITGLCPYRWTEEGYRFNAEKLESFGFDCMRSRRGNDGKFWEHWYLCSTVCAEGDLKAAFEIARRKRGENNLANWKADLQTAIEFLRHNVAFGSLEVCSQRLAAVPGDCR